MAKKIDIAGELNAATTEGIVANAKQVRLGDDNSTHTADELGEYTDNPEFIRVVTDAEDRLLLGLTAEGRPYFPKNETYHVKSNAEWLAVWLDMTGHVLFGIRLDGSTYVAKSEFQDTLSRIEALLEESGVDIADLQASVAALQETVAPLAETFNFISNEEWAHAVVDAEGRLLLGIKADTGEVVMPQQEAYKVVSNAEWLAVWLDTAGHVLFGIRQDGTFYAAKHEFGGDGTDVEAEIAAINDSLAQLGTELSALQETVSGLETGNEALQMLSVSDDPEGRSEMTLDADGKMLSHRDKNGVKHEKKLAIDEVYDDEGKRMELATKEDLSELSITELEGVSNHNTPNLLIPSEMQKTFNDGVNSFTPPNEGYEMSNPIACQAGDWFTRTGTATGMVVVTDKNDTNGVRLFNADGSTLGNTFQIPEDMTWVCYIRMAADVGGAQDGSTVICKGKEAYAAQDRGNYWTSQTLRVEKRNMSKDLLYVQSEDKSKYYQIYVDETGSVRAKEIDPEIIPENEFPSDWHPIALSGSFQGYYDYQLIMNNRGLIVLKEGGPVKIYEPGGNTSVSSGEFARYKSSGGEDRYVASLRHNGPNSDMLLSIFDANFNIIDEKIGLNGYDGGGIDWHDFIYLDDNHLIVYSSNGSANIQVPGAEGITRISGAVINELKKKNGEWVVVGSFKTTDYPQLCTDAFAELGPAADAHSNTIKLDYDGNLLLNERNWESFVKIRRVENEDGSVTLGSETKNYDEAIIGRVGGRHNSGYLDKKRVLSEGFSFTDIPQSLTEVSSDDWEEWQWYHSHDVTFWGMKNIDGHDYPTYTLFDNNYWTENRYSESSYNCLNKRNNSDINPKGDGGTYIPERESSEGYAEHTYSRIVQLTIDWENHIIKDYRIYYIPKKYSREQSGVTMYDEGVMSIAYSYAGEFGLWDFTTDETEILGKVYKGAKQLFSGQYRSYRTCYRANTYKKV